MSGPISNAVFNVVVPPQHAVTGVVQVNGMPPTVTSCTTGAAYLAFRHTTDARFSRINVLVQCGTWAFNTQLYPGVYEVTVGEDRADTSLPAWSTVVEKGWTVSGPISNAVFNVVVPPQHAVTGVVQVNGMPPTVTECTTGAAYLAFRHTTDARFSRTNVLVQCGTWAAGSQDL